MKNKKFTFTKKKIIIPIHIAQNCYYNFLKTSTPFAAIVNMFLHQKRPLLVEFQMLFPSVKSTENTT